MKTLLTLILSLFLFSEAGAATFYVRKTGVDGARGCTNTGADACLTINYAISKLSGGDTLDIGAGTYAEKIDIYNGPGFIPNGGGSWASATTLTASPGSEGQVIIQPNTIDTPVLNMAGTSSWIIFNGLVFDGTNITNWSAGVYSSEFGGFSAQYIKFSNGEVRNVPHAEGMLGAKQFWIVNMKVYNIGATCGQPQLGCHGIYLPDDNNLIENSEVHDAQGMGIQVYQAAHARAHHNTIRNNRIYNNLRAGIVVSSGDANEVYNNLIYGNSEGGIEILDRYSTNYKIYSNTIYGNTMGGITIGGYGGGNPVATDVRNNIIYANSAQITDNGDASTFSANLCGSSGTGCSVIGNPLLASNGSVQSGSPAINAGVNLGAPYNVDYAGNARTIPYDIGAYEYQASLSSIAVSTPTTAATYITQLNSINVTGVAACGTSISSVQWANDRGGLGIASGTSVWSVTGIALMQDRVNTLTFTVNCTGGAQSSITTLRVRANGANRAVLLLALNENAGTSVTDISGLGNNGTFDGTGNTWTTGDTGMGAAVQFDGSGWINIPATNSLDLSIFTLEAKVYPTSAATVFRAVMSKGAGGNAGYFYLFSTSESYFCTSSYPSGGFSGIGVCGKGALSLNTWAHLAVTYDGTTLRLYKDGSEVNTAPSTALQLESALPLKIGNSYFGEGFIGGIDEVRVYNYARTAAEIVADRDTPLGVAVIPVFSVGNKDVRIGDKQVRIGQ